MLVDISNEPSHPSFYEIEKSLGISIKRKHRKTQNRKMPLTGKCMV